MATITYDLVYRDGASVGAPVSNFYLCDTGSELNSLTGMKNGDMGYVKEYRNLYVFNSGWYQCFDGGTINQDITINRWGGTLKINSPGIVPKIRFQGGGDRGVISNNIDIQTGWVKDDFNQSGMMILVDSAEVSVWSAPAGSGILQKFSLGNNGILRINGPIHEYWRPQAQGVWIDIPYNSNDFWASSGSWSVPGDSNMIINSYCLIGKTCIYNFRVNNTNISATPTELYVRIPGILAARYGFGMGFAHWGPTATLTAYASSGSDIIRIARGLFETFPAGGGFHLGITISFSIQ